MGSISWPCCRKKRNLQDVENRRCRILSSVLSWKVRRLGRQHLVSKSSSKYDCRSSQEVLLGSRLFDLTSFFLSAPLSQHSPHAELADRPGDTDTMKLCPVRSKLVVIRWLICQKDSSWQVLCTGSSSCQTTDWGNLVVLYTVFKMIWSRLSLGVLPSLKGKNSKTVILKLCLL